MAFMLIGVGVRLVGKAVKSGIQAHKDFKASLSGQASHLEHAENTPSPSSQDVVVAGPDPAIQDREVEEVVYDRRGRPRRVRKQGPEAHKRDPVYLAVQGIEKKVENHKEKKRLKHQHDADDHDHDHDHEQEDENALGHVQGEGEHARYLGQAPIHDSSELAVDINEPQHKALGANVGDWDEPPSYNTLIRTDNDAVDVKGPIGDDKLGGKLQAVESG